MPGRQPHCCTGAPLFFQGSWCGGRTTRNILLGGGGGGGLSSFVRLVSTVDIEYTNGLPFLPKVGEGDGNPYPLGRRPRPKWQHFAIIRNRGTATPTRQIHSLYVIDDTDCPRYWFA